MAQQIRFLRGVAANLSTILPDVGEPVWVTDTFEFRVGDGVTQGGVPLNFVKTFGSVSQDQVALWESTNNIKGQDKSAFLNGYATETFVNDGLDLKLDVGGKAADSFQTDNALQLGGQLPAFYLNTSQRSNSILSQSETNVATSKAVNDVKIITDTLIDEARITQSYTSTSTTDVPSAAALKNGLDSLNINDKLEADDYAQPTVGGTLKARLDGSDLFLSNDGTNP